MMMKYVVTVVVFLVLLISIEANAAEKPAEKPSGKISGYMFGDYYWVAADHDSALKNQNGFWFRRIYLTYDKGLSEEFTIRFRFEANSPGLREEGNRLNPFIKDAYLKWSRGRHSVLFGLSQTPTWELAEKLWGYRPVEKTPLDLQKFGDSRDFGVTLQGTFDHGKKISYSFMIGNGTGVKSEIDKNKKVYLSFVAKPSEGMTVEAYGDWENRDERKDGLTLQGIAAYERRGSRVGILFAQQIRQQGPGKDDLKLEVFSLFGAGQINEEAWAFGRIDRMFDPIPGSEKIAYIPFSPKGVKSTLLIFGVDLKPIPEVHLMPNVEAVVYDKEEVSEERPDADVIPRLTVYYTF